MDIKDVGGVCVCARVCLVTQVCLILCNPMAYSLPGSSVHVISRERILGWVVSSFFRGSSQPRAWTHVSCVSCTGRQILYHGSTWTYIQWKTTQSFKKKRNSAICNNMDGLGGYYAKWNKSVNSLSSIIEKDIILYDITYMLNQKKKNTTN